LSALASSSTEPLKGCTIMEYVVSRLNVSTSMERNFLKDTVMLIGAGLMMAAVKFTAKLSCDILPR